MAALTFFNIMPMSSTPVFKTKHSQIIELLSDAHKPVYCSSDIFQLFFRPCLRVFIKRIDHPVCTEEVIIFVSCLRHTISIDKSSCSTISS